MNDDKKLSMAIGNFDGIHKGHQTLIKECKKHALKHDNYCAVMTFSPHPKTVLTNNEEYLALLTPINEKKQLFKEYGVEKLLNTNFDREFSSLTAEQFVQEYIVKNQVTAIFVGEDFRYGTRGQGNTTTLAEAGAKSGFTVIVIPAVNYQGQKISSTMIRKMLEQSQVKEVYEVTERWHKILGTVIHGQKKGRELGAATANIELAENYLLPANGVYAVMVSGANMKQTPGVMNIGYRPTVDGRATRLSIEVHLLDFYANLYGAQLVIEFVDYIRAEKKFADLELLSEQIKSDIIKAKHLLL